MIYHRTTSEVRRFDRFKLIVTLVLVALLLWLWLSGRGTGTTAVSTNTNVPATPTMEAPALAAPEPTQPAVATPETTPPDETLPGDAPALAPPAIDLPEGDLLVESEPVAVTIAEAEEPLALAIPSLTPPDSLTGGALALSGTGTPGSQVDVLIDGEVAGTAFVGDDGSWSFDADLGAGDYEISLQAKDSNGNVVASEPVVLSVAAMTPTLDAPVDGTSLDSGEVTFSGAGEPGTELEILDNGLVMGTAVVGEDGQWQFSFTPEAGEHDFAVRAVGSEVTGTAVTMTVNEPAPAPAATTEPAAMAIDCQGQPGVDRGDTYVVGACDWLTKIAGRLGIAYRDLIAVNPQIENPNLIHPGQVINLPPR